MEIVLRPEIMDKIKSDPELFSKMANELGVRPITLPQILAANKPRLTQASVLRILREHLGITQDNDLLTETQEVD